MQRIFFFHLPKAGGTSIRTALKRHLPDATICPVIANNIAEHRGVGGDYSDYRNYDIYCGHYGRDICDSVRQDHRSITNFRHPVARIVSLYNYFRHAVTIQQGEIDEDAFRPIDLARRQGFGEFVASTDPLVEIYICNNHYRQLTNSMWSLDHVGSVPEVCRFIDAMPCYYVCEFPELSRIWMRQALGIDDIPVDNMTRGEALLDVATLNPSIFDLVCRRNELDLALYRHAVDRMLRLNVGDIAVELERFSRPDLRLQPVQGRD